MYYSGIMFAIFCIVEKWIVLFNAGLFPGFFGYYGLKTLTFSLKNWPKLLDPPQKKAKLLCFGPLQNEKSRISKQKKNFDCPFPCLLFLVNLRFWSIFQWCWSIFQRTDQFFNGFGKFYKGFGQSFKSFGQSFKCFG